MLGRSSPLRVEINPWTLDITLDEVMGLRGAYIAAFGMIEMHLTELAIRCSKHDAYSTVRAQFPSRRPERLKFLEAVCEIEGPLSPHRGLIISIVRRFRDGLKLRDLLAHGRMRVLSGPEDDASIKFDDYSAGGELINYRRENWTLKTLRQTTYRAAQFSRCVDSLYPRVNDLLPDLEGEFRAL